MWSTSTVPMSSITGAWMFTWRHRPSKVSCCEIGVWVKPWWTFVLCIQIPKLPVNSVDFHLNDFIFLQVVRNARFARSASTTRNGKQPRNWQSSVGRINRQKTGSWRKLQTSWTFRRRLSNNIYILMWHEYILLQLYTHLHIITQYHNLPL